MLNVIKAHAVNNLCYIKAQKMSPQGIVVHSTGANNPNLKRYVDAPSEVGVNQYGNHWNTAKPSGRSVCVHAFIGYDKNKEIRVAEILPLNFCCWGVGQGKKGSYNYNPAYIQFEICEDSLADKVYYQKVFSTAAQYCAELCRTYNIDVDKIVGHCEAYKLGYGSNHSDPEHWMKNFGETMEDFRKRVSEILKNNKGNIENKEEAVEKSQSIQKGDLVSIAPDATYFNGKSVPSWVKSQNWYVVDNPTSERVVIDKNESGTNSIRSPINVRYLTIVKKGSESSSKGPAEKEENNGCPYRVKVITSCLFIRNGADKNAEKVDAISDWGVYTIVEEKDGAGATKWGKLKSGAGWISLDYVRKI